MFYDAKKLTFIAALSMSATVLANNEPVDYHFYNSDEEVQIDGDLSEPVWQQATKMELPYNINPGENTPAPVKTEVMLFENGESVFVAFKAYDPNPEQIRAYYRNRDTIFQDDFVGIVLDTFNDERRAYEFFVNAYGVQGDLIKDDTQGGREDSNWDAIWDSAGQITDDGYIVEMEIPFKALRFPSDQEAMTWGIDAMRVYPRDSRMVLSSNKSERDIDCHLCQISKINGLKDLKQGSNFQLTPTITASRNDEKEDVPGPWEEGDFDGEAGIDLRWGVNQNLYLNATLNPDFSTVEADAAQLDVNNTFALFTREKRPFFLDGKDYFNTQRMNLVHTRNINAPEYGVKLTGKNGAHTYGVLAANDKSTSFLVPGSSGSDVADHEVNSDAFVGRYMMDIGERSNVGVLVTDRAGESYHNTVTSIDGRHQFNKANSINYQVAYSDTTNPQEVVDDFEEDYSVKKSQSDRAYSLGYVHRTRDYTLRASYADFGKDFRADLGFVGRNNYKRGVIGGSYTWYGEEGSDWTRWGVWGDYDKTYDQDGLMLEEEVEMHGNLQGPKQFTTNFGIVHRKAYWEGDYYNITNPMMFARFDPLPNLRVWAWGMGGDRIDYHNNQKGDGLNLELGGNLKIGKHASTEVNFNHSTLDVDGGKLFTADQFDVRFNYQFNLKSSIRLIVQYTDIERDTSLYTYDEGTEEDDKKDHIDRYFSTSLLYAYKLNPQSLFYLGYSDGGYQDDDLNDLEKDNRSLFMKVSYAWQM